MNKLINPIQNGGFPWENEDILKLQQNPIDMFYHLFQDIGNYFVIDGVKVTAQDVGASTCIVSAGFVWMDSEMLYFPGYTGTYPFHIQSDTPTYTTKVFEDGLPKNAYVDRVAKAVIAYNPAVQQIVCEPAPRFRYHDMITQAVRTNVSSLNTSVQSLQSLVNTKATIRSPYVPWTNIVLEGTATYNYPTYEQAPQYMCDETGRVHLRGVVRVRGANIGGINRRIGQIPAALAPPKASTVHFVYQFNAYEGEQTGNVIVFGQTAQVINPQATTGAIDVNSKTDLSTSAETLFLLDGTTWSIL